MVVVLNQFSPGQHQTKSLMRNWFHSTKLFLHLQIIFFVFGFLCFSSAFFAMRQTQYFEYINFVWINFFSSQERKLEQESYKKQTLTWVKIYTKRAVQASCGVRINYNKDINGAVCWFRHHDSHRATIESEDDKNIQIAPTTVMLWWFINETVK